MGGWRGEYGVWEGGRGKSAAVFASLFQKTGKVFSLMFHVLTNHPFYQAKIENSNQSPSFSQSVNLYYCIQFYNCCFINKSV